MIHGQINIKLHTTFCTDNLPKHDISRYIVMQPGGFRLSGCVLKTIAQGGNRVYLCVSLKLLNGLR